METRERFDLIKRNTEEIITEDELLKLLETKKQPAVYLGTAITGRPHIGYFVWVLKLADFLKAGFKVKLLLADLHGALDNTPWELLTKRYDYYSAVIPAMFQSVGADIKNFEIVKGSDFEKSESYFFDLLKLSTISSQHDAKKAASEVVKQSDNPKVSGLIYPMMQALDEEYLKVDIQYGGVDQRKIFMFAREYLPKLGYKSRVEVMTPLIPGLVGEKMSASVEDSKVDLLDTSETIKRKLNKAYCPEAVVEGNGVLAFIKHVVMVVKQDANSEFVIERPVKWGGTLRYKSYEEFESDYVNKKVHPQDVKQAITKEIDLMLEPVRKAMHGKEKLIKEAYL